MQTGNKIGNSEYRTQFAFISRGVKFAGIPNGTLRNYTNAIPWTPTAVNNVANITNNNSTYKLVDNMVTLSIQCTFNTTAAQPFYIMGNLPIVPAPLNGITYVNMVTNKDTVINSSIFTFSTIDPGSSLTNIRVQTLFNDNLVAGRTYILNAVVQYLTEEKSLSL